MMRPVVALKYNHQDSVSVQFAEYIAHGLGHELRVLTLDLVTHEDKVCLTDVSTVLEEMDASLVVVQLSGQVSVQQFLNAFKTLRIPYLFVHPTDQPHFEKVALPVTFLIEDKEKGPFAAAFGRFFGSKLLIFKPKDYGTKAMQNIEAMQTLFDSFDLNYEVIQARKNSYDVEREVALGFLTNSIDLVIISASREYGLDDIIFGSKERKIITHASMPVLVINPRGDLYTLCD